VRRPLWLDLEIVAVGLRSLCVPRAVTTQRRPRGGVHARRRVHEARGSSFATISTSSPRCVPTIRRRRPCLPISRGPSVRRRRSLQLLTRCFATPIQLTPGELDDLVAFVRNGLLDPAQRPTNCTSSFLMLFRAATERSPSSSPTRTGVRRRSQRPQASDDSAKQTRSHASTLPRGYAVFPDQTTLPWPVCR